MPTYSVELFNKELRFLLRETSHAFGLERISLANAVMIFVTQFSRLHPALMNGIPTFYFSFTVLVINSPVSGSITTDVGF